mmetsp:Transcript_2251/g.2525  ORF Transcript_2251/g.2525 Transcript_2251/m.2525 type:complete len:98 (-) Transcript_2251:302-595(-)
MSCLLSTHYYCIVYLSGSLSVLDGDLSSHLETWIYFTNRPTIEVLGTVLFTNRVCRWRLSGLCHVYQRRIGATHLCSFHDSDLVTGTLDSGDGTVQA